MLRIEHGRVARAHPEEARRRTGRCRRAGPRRARRRGSLDVPRALARGEQLVLGERTHRLDAAAEVRPERRQVGRAREAAGHADDRDATFEVARRHAAVLVPTRSRLASVALEEPPDGPSPHWAGEVADVTVGSVSDSPAVDAYPLTPVQEGMLFHYLQGTQRRRRHRAVRGHAGRGDRPRRRCDPRGSGSPTDTRSCAPGSAGPTATSRTRRS